MTKAKSEGVWRALVKELENSGMSAEAFAEQRGINMRTVKWWRSYFRRERREVEPRAANVQFAKVRQTAESSPVRSEIQETGLAVFAGGVRIGVQPGFDRATLAALLDALDTRHQDRR